MKILVNKEILDNFQLRNHEYLVDIKHYDDLCGIQEYRLYSYLSTFFNNTTILDIGTFNGRSAIALSHNENNHVISYDIEDYIKNQIHKIYTKSNITFKIKDIIEDLTPDLLKNVKIVMIDIDHLEIIERKIIYKLNELNYSGIIILDNIKHPCPKEYECMQKLWNNLNFKKYDVTKYGHFSGTGIVLMNTDIDFVFEKNIFVEGEGGLGNCLFQIATAIYYAEKYGYNILLNNTSESLHIGTANFTNRCQGKIINGNIISYKDTIFKKLKYSNLDKNICKIIYNNFTDNHIIPTYNDESLLISGYCQNKNLYQDIIPYIFNYLNLYNHEDIQYLIDKYNIDMNKKNIMLGIRICDDFKHMTKITSNSYKKALNNLVGEEDDNYNLIIISDSQNFDKILDFEIKGRIININDDDITQINAGLLCENFILSESTFHYWIALLKNSLKENINVVCFNNTDLTNRNLVLDNWIKIDY